MKEIDRKNYIDFEKYVDGLYDKNKGNDGVWLISKKEMNELLLKSYELNIRHRKSHTMYKTAPVLLRHFGYDVDKGATNPASKKYPYKKLTKRETVYYTDSLEGVIVEQVD